MTETTAATSGPIEVWITGIGLATSLGEGLDANWDALNQRRINVDEKSFAPYIVHPWAPVNLDAQIPKKGDQRQMEAWQRIGTYAAGLALDSAGVKGNKEILGRMDMIVAAGGGERDLAVDSNILNLEAKGNSAPGFLNERLMNDLRPTLFLAQLSNLLAGNISIVHGVTGSSRTFMGEEAAGVDAVRIALARIMAGQSDVALVGGSYNGEREDLALLYNAGGQLLQRPFKPVWERSNSPGLVLASLGAFLVLEGRSHAQQRGAKPLARLLAVRSDRSRRPPAAVAGSLAQMWEQLAPARARTGLTILSGATGTEPGTKEERAWLASIPEFPVRATGSRLGHGFEPQFAMNIALATLVLDREKLFPAFDSSGVEHQYDGPVDQVAVTSVGHWRGEGIALVEA